MPDSLKSEFTTQNGRKVFDGGGVDPDIEVEPVMPAPITISLSMKGLLFEYALMYHFSHENIVPAKEFNLTEEEYQSFVKWLDGKEYDYTTKVEKTIENLTKYAKSEKYYDAIKDELEDLEKKAMHNKERDLIEFKAEIKSVLEDRIVENYFLMKGNFEGSFDSDIQIQTAIEVLQDTVQYNSILTTSVK